MAQGVSHKDMLGEVMRGFAIGFLAVTLGSELIGSGPVIAAESEGGSIGGTIDSHQNSQPTRTRAKASPPATPKTVERRSPKPSVSGGGASFDGAWSVTSNGSCTSGSTGQATISGGRVIDSRGVVTGRVSPSGAVSTATNYNGVTITSRGQINGRSASGTFQQSDGCAGRWSAIKL